MRSVLHTSSLSALRSLATLTAIVAPSVAFSGSLSRWETQGSARREARAHHPLRPTAFQKQVRMMASGPKVPIQIIGNNIEVIFLLSLFMRDMCNIWSLFSGYTCNQGVC